MTTKEIDQKLVASILGVAGGVRKVVAQGHSRIDKILDESGSTKKDHDEFLRFAYMYMLGATKDGIFEEFNVSTELRARLDFMFQEEK